MNKLLVLFLVATQAYSATYYVDYGSADDSADGLSSATPWKRCPGMVGFAGSYSHESGDTFKFKGGVTWPGTVFPLTIANSGSGIGSEDVYTGDSNWYSGASWSFPVFDGDAVQDAYGNGLIAGATKGNIVISSIKVIDVGSLTDGSGTAIMCNGNNIELKYCWIEPNSVNGFFSSGAGGVGKLYIHHNMFRKMGRVHISTADNMFDDVRFHDNLFPGSPDWESFAYHSDGLMIGADGEGDWKLTNVRIYNNKWYGDWSEGATAHIYCNGSPGKYGIRYCWIYNNLLVTEHTSGGSLSPAFISLAYGQGDFYIYNNTIDGRSRPIVSHGITTSYTNYNLFTSNNIIAGVDNGITISADTGGTVTVDNTLFYTVGANHFVWDNRTANRYNTIGALQAAGFGVNYAAQADPKFVTLPSGGVEGSGNWHLQSDSPAIGNAVNLNTLFTTDLDGITRGATWDIGAYQYRFIPTKTGTINTLRAGTLRIGQ